MQIIQMRTHSFLALALIAGLFQADFAHPQNWRTKDSEGMTRIIDDNGVVLQVYDLDGNLVQTHPVVPPFLQSMGNVILQTPDNSNFYLSRVGATLNWQLTTVSPPTSTLPGFLELDGKWYALRTGFVQAFYSPNDHLVDSSAVNCTAGGAALPAGINPRLTLSGMTINLTPTEPILIEHLANADVIRMKSRTANISCNGQVVSPITESMLKDGFENPPP